MHGAAYDAEKRTKVCLGDPPCRSPTLTCLIHQEFRNRSLRQDLSEALERDKCKSMRMTRFGKWKERSPQSQESGEVHTLEHVLQSFNGDC
jgi:hypothetical protein